MKKSKFSPSQIAKILKEFSEGENASELSRKYNISQGTLYSWRKKYGGMEASELKRLKELEEENARLKETVA